MDPGSLGDLKLLPLELRYRPRRSPGGGVTFGPDDVLVSIGGVDLKGSCVQRMVLEIDAKTLLPTLTVVLPLGDVNVSALVDVGVRLLGPTAASDR